MSDSPPVYPKLADLLSMTVGELLTHVVEYLGRAQHSAESDPWVDIRTPEWPHRRILASAQQGEVHVAKVGRRLLMRRSELNRWLDARKYRHRERRPRPTIETERDARVAQLHSYGYSLEEANLMRTSSA